MSAAYTLVTRNDSPVSTDTLSDETHTDLTYTANYHRPADIERRRRQYDNSVFTACQLLVASVCVVSAVVVVSGLYGAVLYSAWLTINEDEAHFPAWTFHRCSNPSLSSLRTDTPLYSYFSCTQLVSATINHTTTVTADCAAANVVARPFSFFTAGFAAVFDRMALDLIEAAGRIPPHILYHDPATVDSFAYAAGCPSHDWTCLFQPITPCSAAELSSSSHHTSAPTSHSSPVSRLPTPVDLSVEDYYLLSESLTVSVNVNVSDWPLVELYSKVPEAALVDDWQRSMHATLQSERVHRWLIVWSAAQVWLFQPNSAMQSAIDNSKERMGWPAAVESAARPTTLGMHIRHGDKAADGNPLFPLSTYMQQAQHLRTRHPHLSTVYIATDDAASVLSELPPYRQQGWHFLTLNLSDEVHVAGRAEAAQYALYHPEVAQSMAVDIVRVIGLLSECSLLIGQCMSQVYRAALGIAFAHHRLLEPGVALDYNHCLSSKRHYYPVVEPFQPPVLYNR